MSEQSENLSKEDPVLHQQLQAFADHLRGATGSDVAVVITASRRPNGTLAIRSRGATGFQSAMLLSRREGARDEIVMGVTALVSAATEILRKYCSDPSIELLVRSASKVEPMPLPPGRVKEFI